MCVRAEFAYGEYVDENGNRPFQHLEDTHKCVTLMTKDI